MSENVEKRLSLLESELKSIIKNDDGGGREMSRLLRLYELKLGDLQLEKKKLDSYCESLERQISELVNMSAEARDLRYILRNQKLLEERIKELESELHLKTSEIERLESSAGVLRNSEMNQLRNIYDNEVRVMRAQFEKDVSTLKSAYAKALGDEHQAQEQRCLELRSACERHVENVKRQYQGEIHEYMQKRDREKEELLEKLSQILKPIVTISLCKQKQSSS